MIISMMLGHLYVNCMRLEKRMSKLLMIPDILFLCKQNMT